MAIPREQPFYCTAAWSLLRAFAADKAAYRAAHPEGYVIEHNFLDDLRKYIMFLMFSPHAGNYDEEAMQWDAATYVGHWSTPSTRVIYFAGELTVCTFDKSQGMGTYDPLTGLWSGEWLWWVNNRKLTEQNMNDDLDPPFAAPPTYYDDNGVACSKIHPDTWVLGQFYAADAKVSYLTGWKAKREIINKNIAPHIWTGKIWEEGHYTKGNYVIVADGINVYKSIKDVINSQEYSDIESVSPEEDSEGFWEIQPLKAIEWEADTLWDDTNGNWSLAFNKNKFSTADYFTNCKIIHSNAIVEDGEIAFEAIQNAAASAFFPKQVNPRTKFKPLIFFTSETQSAQFREKVSCSTAEVNNVATLGARFSSESLIDWYYGTNMVHMKRVDGNGVLAIVAANKSTSCPCNQYAIEGCEPHHNSPINSSDWYYNDKCVGGGIINYLEMLLNCGVFSMSSDSIAANWVIAHGNSTNFPATIDYNSELHGCNESGSELFLKNLGQFDWYYDDDTPYVPLSIIEAATAHEAAIQEPAESGLSADLLLTKWDAKPIGTYRRTWKHTLGRVSPWMRSKEMGEPTRATWNPVFGFWLDEEQTRWFARPCAADGRAVMTSQFSGIDYNTDAKWFGSRVMEEPTVTVFDDRCKAITALELSAIGWVAEVPYKKNVFVSDAGDIYYAKANIVNLTTAPHSNLTEWSIVTNYTCTVAEDITADLQIAWMVKLAPATNSLISACTPAYVLSCAYDEVLEKTILLLSKPISTNGYIHWNKEISQRHDGINASWGDNPEDCNIYYYPQAELLLGLFTTIQNVRYIQVSPSVELIQLSASGDAELSTYDGGAVNDNAQFALARGKCLAYRPVNPGYPPLSGYSSYYPQFGVQYWKGLGSWNGNDGVVGVVVGRDHGYNPYQNWYECSGTIRYYGVAVRATWTQKLKNLPRSIGVEFIVPDVCGYTGDPPVPIPGIFSQSAGTPAGMITSVVKREPPLESRKFTALVGISDAGSDGGWYKILPIQLSAMDYDGEIPGYLDSAMYVGEAKFSLSVSTNPILVPIEPDDSPQSIWDRTMLYHIDCPPDFTEDTNAPLPNPAQYSYKPMGYIAFTPPVGYAGEAGYEEPTMELVARGVVGLGNDVEGNNPPEYRSVCIEDSNYNTEYNINPVTIKHLADITIPTLAIDLQLIIESGISSDFPRPAGYDNDDVIWYKSAAEDCLMKVCSSVMGSGYMTLETLGDMQNYTYTGLKAAYNLTKAYNAAMWAASPFTNLHFVAQAQDAIGNESDLGEECLILEPPEYPADTIAAFIENGS